MGSPSQWSLSLVFAVGTLNYIYKVLAALVLTPVIYAMHHYINRWLGQDLAHEMMEEASSQ